MPPINHHELMAAAQAQEARRLKAMSMLEEQSAALRQALEELLSASANIQDESPGAPMQAFGEARAKAKATLAGAVLAGRSLLSKVAAGEAAIAATVKALRPGPMDLLIVTGPEGMEERAMRHFLEMIGKAAKGRVCILAEPGFTVEQASKVQLQRLLDAFA